MSNPKPDPSGEGRQRLSSRLSARVMARQSSGAILRGHHTLTPVARQALKLIARYPLLAARDLAALLGVSRNKLVAPLRALQMLELICDHDGLLVLPSGLGLLAGWLRISARALARYSPWRLRRIGGGYAESVQGLLRLRDHNRRVAQFAAGLREQGVSLQWWDNPLDGEGPAQLLSPTRHGHVIPDAIGALRVVVAAHELAHERTQSRTRALERPSGVTRPKGSTRPHVVMRQQAAICTVWLEVDRDTMQGQRLRAKLMRYYALQQAWLSRSQRPPVIVFLVDGGESRLQELRRKVRELDARFGMRLPVWFARTDQLRVGRSDPLHPLRRVWRTAHASDLVCPFEGDPDGDPSA